MSTPDAPKPSPPDDDALRPHSYDGIVEYDKRLPRWWLLTLYGTMIFSVLYWAYYHAYGLGLAPDTALEVALVENAARAAQKSGVLDDDALWRMSQDAATVAAGKAVFDTTCAACHKPDMTGLIGPNLVDNQWIHGGKPMDSVKLVTEGVLTKGMPAWGPLLGREKIAAVCAYIFSHHKPGEEIIAVPGWTPPAGVVVPPPPPPSP